MTKPRLSEWQRQVLADLDAVAAAYPGDVVMLGKYRLQQSGSMQLRLSLRTADIPRVAGGLHLGSQEEVIVTVGRAELTPPIVEVDHLRFLHYPHVLAGRRLCVYLDPSREWDPASGFRGFLDRLFQWFHDAAAGRFDAQTALYHAVGGFIHADKRAPTIVVREAVRTEVRAQHGWLVDRTPHRFDLCLKRPPGAGGVNQVPVVTLDADLPFGAGIDLRSFLQVVDDPYLGHPPAPGSACWGSGAVTGLAAMILTVLGASAIRKVDGSPQRLIVAVPHPAGGPPHLLAANVPARGADHIRALVRAKSSGRCIMEIDPEHLDPATPLEWWPVSDEREDVTTRRDATRPVAGYAGRTVHVWGCGGLGSWVAEFVVRAGAKKVVLCDPGTISGGLLVRQNFIEADVGNTKVDALAQRLRAISDTVEVVSHDEVIPADGIDGCDVIIDATVNIAIGRLLDDIARTSGNRPLLAQIATDARTGTMGIMTVSASPLRDGPMAIDRRAGKQIVTDGSLEAFHVLWNSSSHEDQLIPTRGCSTPTFHGSAADLAGVAASLVSILGAHLGKDGVLSGTHLISLPHGEAGPLRAFVIAPPSVGSDADSVGAA